MNETFRFNLYLVDYDKEFKKALMERLLAHHKTQGKIWARELLKKVRAGEKVLIHQSNASLDVNVVLRDLSVSGAMIEVEDLFPDEEDDE